MKSVDPKQMLNELKSTVSIRKQHTLDLIYEILERHAESGNCDFSIATIGRLVSDAGGPSVQALRNSGGLEYRRLIEAWAVSQGTTLKKPSSKKQNQIPSQDEDILKRIDDAALRAVVGSIIAERNRLKNEIRTLKSQTILTIDRRPANHIVSNASQPLAETNLLSELEQEALKHAISDKLLKNRGWRMFDNGRIKDENNRHLYKPGYVSAIEKLLKRNEQNKIYD